ncbi:TetR/AcrR family transcriptional regulator [Planotetraspora sp. A-T 1434]|uniref:TetR/AcrR family transcriptional regulator n=1 Tax=Planotetraspora sp. A-T 1434 TaxID=2979219 RepID=UPI0021C02327|nr:TetR/AcrR family transcriptional regulator [Planotetraspora sp. A-T 1434]MCT9928793.1 TetR/AcrR family transcriptional regulator [Planotetraspora sp. A-T 1434]
MQDAAATRADILRTARELFSSEGYARVTVTGIAQRAGVATKTVYASAGSKVAIFKEILMTAVTGSGAEETLAAVRKSDDPREALRILAHGTRVGNETHRDAMEMLHAAISVQDDAEALWQQGTTLYREALHQAAVHLGEIGGLADGLDADRAADILWFCLGTGAWRTLVDDCGWSWDDAERWLAVQALTLLHIRPASDEPRLEARPRHGRRHPAP